MGKKSMPSMEDLLERIKAGFLRCSKRVCPCCILLLCTEHNQHKKLKAVAGFIYGLILGLVLYVGILVDLEFGKITTLCLAAFISLVLALGNAFSTQVRCITLLTFPSFCGKAGREVLKTIVLAYVLAGPFTTISNNAKEVVRVFGCKTTLAYNLTKTRYELMIKPFQDALYQMKHDTREVAETLQSIQTVIEPIVEEVEDEEEVLKLKEENDYIDRLQGDSLRSKEIEDKYKRISDRRKREGENNPGEEYEIKYKKKIEYRCQDVISKGAGKCREAFSNAYDKCYEAVSVVVAWLLCWPMKLNFICNLAEVFGGKSLCDPSKEIEPGFGEGYTTLKDMKRHLGEELNDVNIQFKITNPLPQVDLRSAADIARSVTKAFQEKKNIFDVVILFAKRILALFFLRVIFKAAQYHDKYLTDIEFDNKYITKYFRHIDDRRRKRGLKTLLPIKKIERKNFIDIYAPLPMNEERKRMVGQSFKLILEMITATTFILLDRLFYETLDIVSRHALVEYTQTGEHDMSLTVKGTGMIANMVRSIVKGFNFKKRVHVIHSNKSCLPRPIMLPNYYLYKIYGTYFMIWMFILLEGYTQRLNRAIGAYFYRKREKRRILFLYNESLKRRIGFFRYTRAKIRRQAREVSLAMEANIFLKLRMKKPKQFGWLRYLPVGKRKCLICGEPEPVKPGIFHECSTNGCDYVHCPECWNDIGKVCFGCRPAESDEDTAIEDEDIIM